MTTNLNLTDLYNDIMDRRAHLKELEEILTACQQLSHVGVKVVTRLERVIGEDRMTLAEHIRVYEQHNALAAHGRR